MRPAQVLTALLLAPGAAEAARIQTCGDVLESDCALSIEDALAAAVTGDTVVISAGAYEEAIAVTKGVTLEGQPGHVLMDPSDPRAKNVVTVTTAEPVVLSGLRIVTARARPIALSGADVTISNARLRSDGLAYQGGLLRAQGSDLDVSSSEFSLGTAVQGGQVYLEMTSATFTSCDFAGGTAIADGGAIAAVGAPEGGLELFLVKSSFTGNTASEAGGAVHADGLLADVHSTSFEGNAADSGGAIAAVGGGTLVVDASAFRANTAAKSGAALLADVEATVTATLFEANDAPEAGAVWASTPRRIVGNRFCANTADLSGSAVLVALDDADETLLIGNNLFASNRTASTAVGTSGTVEYIAGDETPGAATLLVRFNTFLENGAGGGSAVSLSLATGWAAEVTGNLFAWNEAFGDETTGGGYVVLPGDAAQAVHHNLWFENAGEDTVPEGFEPSGVYGDPELVRWDAALCGIVVDTEREPDPMWPAWGTAGRDRGPEESADADGTRSDIGAHGGPDADASAWADLDEDGYPAAYDCAPSDPDVHPELEDVPYDGVDRDCDFWSDHDADRDGWDRELDCDDDDAAVHPDAEDVPYDTIDQDCEGGDENDLDGDGWPKGEGQDCDDDDPTVNPGQSRDEWNRDRNCDGYATALVPGCATTPGAGPWALIFAVLLLRGGGRRLRGGGLPARREFQPAAGWKPAATRTWPAATALLLLLAADASAQECEPLGESEFRTLVLDSQAAIDRDDVGLHEAIVDEVRDRIPCLDFRPNDRLWADFLVGVAIVEFARGGDWETWLAAALRVRPGVDRGVGSGHPMASWTPPPPSAAPGGAVPIGETLYVDGKPAAALPPPEGLYLVQREREGVYVSRLVVNEPVPADWLAEPIPVPVPFSSWGLASLRLGAAGALQRPGMPTPFVPKDSWVGPMPSADLRAGATYGRVAIEASGSMGVRSLGDLAAHRAHFALLGVAGPWRVGGGAGVVSATVFEGEGEALRLRDVPLPWGVAVVERRDPAGLDASLRFGASASLARLEARAGWIRPESPNVRYGFEIGGQDGFFRQNRAPEGSGVQSFGVWALAEVGVVLGEGW